MKKRLEIFTQEYYGKLDSQALTKHVDELEEYLASEIVPNEVDSQFEKAILNLLSIELGYSRDRIITLGFDYLAKTKQEYWSEFLTELVRLDEVYSILKYLEDYHSFPSEIEAIKQYFYDTESIEWMVDLSVKITKTRWQELENILVHGVYKYDLDIVDLAITYTKNVIQGRWLELETALLWNDAHYTDPSSYEYLAHNELTDDSYTNIRGIIWYDYLIMQGKWEEGQKFVYNTLRNRVLAKELGYA